jgi:multiple sugar transport system substrate-binding protein
MTDENVNHPVYGPFIKGLEYAKTTVFANESAQRQAMVDMMQRIELQGQALEESVAQAAEEEQKILDEYYKK